jgi:hypothetical protein
VSSIAPFLVVVVAIAVFGAALVWHRWQQQIFLEAFAHAFVGAVAGLPGAQCASLTPTNPDCVSAVREG